MKETIGRIVLGVSALLLTGLALEGAFRLLGLRGFHGQRSVTRLLEAVPPEERLDGLRYQVRPNQIATMRYENDPRGYFGPRGGVFVAINSHGLRGPEFSREKPDGVLRIAVLGDSFTFGEGVRWEDTFTEQLERELGPHLDSPLEVLNLALPWWGTQDEVRFFEQRGFEFAPDVVLIAYVLNDADYAGGLELLDGFRRAQEASGALRGSYLLSWAWARLIGDLRGRRYVEAMVASALQEREKWQESLRWLNRGRDAAAARGASFAVVLYPFLYRLDASYPFGSLHERIVEHCRSAGIPVLDLFPAFAGRDHATLWVHATDQHPNEIGHGIAARATTDFLLERGLLIAPQSGRGRPGREGAAGPAGRFIGWA